MPIITLPDGTEKKYDFTFSGSSRAPESRYYALRQLFEQTDLMMHALINNGDFKLPQLAPDGNYCPENNISGDINGDQLVNVLDVVLVVNMILGTSEINYDADLNGDGGINIQDMLLIINIILSSN